MITARAIRIARQAIPALHRATGARAVLLVADRIVVVPPTDADIAAAQAMGGRLVGVYRRPIDVEALGEAVREVADGR
jgi:hypothetical protein